MQILPDPAPPQQAGGAKNPPFRAALPPDPHRPPLPGGLFDRELSGERFAFPIELLEEKPAGTILTLFRRLDGLVDHWTRLGKSNPFGLWPSATSLSAITGMSTRAVQLGLRWLAEHGWIEITHWKANGLPRRVYWCRWRIGRAHRPPAPPGPPREGKLEVAAAAGPVAPPSAADAGSSANGPAPKVRKRMTRAGETMTTPPAPPDGGRDGALAAPAAPAAGTAGTSGSGGRTSTRSTEAFAAHRSAAGAGTFTNEPAPKVRKRITQTGETITSPLAAPDGGRIEAFAGPPAPTAGTAGASAPGGHSSKQSIMVATADPAASLGPAASPRPSECLLMLALPGMNAARAAQWVWALIDQGAEAQVPARWKGDSRPPRPEPEAQGPATAPRPAILTPARADAEAKARARLALPPDEAAIARLGDPDPAVRAAAVSEVPALMADLWSDHQWENLHRKHCGRVADLEIPLEGFLDLYRMVKRSNKRADQKGLLFSGRIKRCWPDGPPGPRSGPRRGRESAPVAAPPPS